jgi:hypothetical protein
MLRQTLLAAVLSLPCGLVNAQIATTTTLTSITPTAPVFGQVVTITAQVTPALAPGSVSFMDGGVLVGVRALNASGVAQMTTVTLPAGPHAIRVVYGGNGGGIKGGYLASQSPVVPYVVTAVPGAGFPTQTGYGVWLNPSAVVAADFNGDGKADLAATNAQGNNISVFLGNGDGTFLAPVNYAAGTSPASVAVGDFNGDGKADLVVSNSGGFSVLLGNGDGMFRTAMNTAGSSGALAVGDFMEMGTRIWWSPTVQRRAFRFCWGTAMEPSTRLSLTVSSTEPLRP